MYRTFRWYYKERNIMKLLILFPPVGIYLMFKYTKWEKRGKIIITSIHIFLFLLIVTLAGLWIFTVDHTNNVELDAPTSYNCETSSNENCLISQLEADLTSDKIKGIVDINLHRSITTSYPNKTLGFVISYSPNENYVTNYEIVTLSILKDISIDELDRLEYEIIEVSITSTYYEDSLPLTELMITYHFTVANLMAGTLDSANSDDMANYIAYQNDFLSN